MRFGSVCSGIEAASVAWLPLGWQCQFMSEIEAFPRAVLAHHYPDTPLHGDFTTIKAGEFGPIDVLVGGTPCQSFSVAGLRGGMADERGNLALEYLRLADRLRPRWVVWENVPGVLSSAGGRDFGAFLGGLGECGYGWSYRVLDAQYFGLAQRRKRVFVVGHLGDWRRAAAVLFEPTSLQGHPPPRRAQGESFTHDVAPSIGASGRGFDRAGETRGQDPVVATALRARDGARGVDSDCTDTLVANTLRVPSHGATWRGDGCDNIVSHALNAHGGSGRIDAESETFVTGTLTGNGDAHSGFKDEFGLIAHSLRADGFDASEDGTGRGTPLVAFQTSQSGVRQHDTHATLDANNGSRRHNGAIVGSAVRRLTPRECEKLQGFSPDYTLIPHRGKPAADGPRYRALGNSFAVPVVRWIGRRIQQASA